MEQALIAQVRYEEQMRAMAGVTKERLAAIKLDNAAMIAHARAHPQRCENDAAVKKLQVVQMVAKYMEETGISEVTNEDVDCIPGLAGRPDMKPYIEDVLAML